MVEVGIGGGEGAEALVVAAVVVVVDEGGNGGLDLARQEVVLQQDAVLQGLAPACRSRRRRAWWRRAPSGKSPFYLPRALRA